MCRNIKTLFNFEPRVTADEIRAASLQFVRKISGFNKPSKANEATFLAAVDEIASISTRLLRSLETNAPPKSREEEAAKAKARGDSPTRRVKRSLARQTRVRRYLPAWLRHGLVVIFKNPQRTALRRHLEEPLIFQR